MVVYGSSHPMASHRRIACSLSTYLSAFRDRGVPGPTSEMSSRAPAQMGRREAEHEGGKKGGRRRAWERWKSRGLRVRPAPRSGALAVGGYKRPRGRGSERPHASACPVLVPTRPSCSSRAQVGCACSRGLQASTRERERAASRERLSRPRPRAANPL
jgi:hypothetical protein